MYSPCAASRSTPVRSDLQPGRPGFGKSPGLLATVPEAERLPRELMHIFKIENKRIDEIEAMGVLLPYMSTNGWTDFLK